jgi:cell wall-associated NlpC family hydrolase
VSGSELEALSRAHQLFARGTHQATLQADPRIERLLDDVARLNTGGRHDLYRQAVHRSRLALRSAAETDTAVAAVAARAEQDHAQARRQTRSVYEEALTDVVPPDSPMAQREAIRRRVARLHRQRAHVLSAHQQARRHRTALRALRYRTSPRRGTGPADLRLPPANSRAGLAVRAALSRLGRPYVWGATGPNQFDCSGLTQWAYAQAGIHLDRTTYQQINEGIPVPRSQIRPGDLVFPNSGHVQLSIGNNLVVEAPHAGATVRVSALGAGVQIRRPLS